MPLWRESLSRVKLVAIESKRYFRLYSVKEHIYISTW